MFGIRTDSLPYIRSYADALRCWERAAVRRRTGERHLGTKNQWSFTIHRHADHSIGLQFHGFEHVRYYPDGHYDIRAYSSASSQRFTNEVLPTGVYVDFMSVLANSVRTNGLWRQLDGTPYKIPKVDRKRFNALLGDYRFKEYEVWYAAASELGVVRTVYPHTEHFYAKRLLDQANWYECSIVPPSQWRRMIRKQALNFTEYEHLQEHEYRNAQSLVLKYGRA